MSNRPYRHVPVNVPSRRSGRSHPVLFWTLSIVFAVGLSCVIPFGFLLVLPFMIGFLSKVNQKPEPPTFDPRHPYDGMRRD